MLLAMILLGIAGLAAQSPEWIGQPAEAVWTIETGKAIATYSEGKVHVAGN